MSRVKLRERAADGCGEDSITFNSAILPKGRDGAVDREPGCAGAASPPETSSPFSTG